MAEQFRPELGQWMKQNDCHYYEIAMQPHVTAAIYSIGEAIEAKGLCSSNPAGNVGDGFENEVFAMRAYCWCDGERHVDGCPPNFECGDFSANWYKHLHRGASQSRDFHPTEWSYGKTVDGSRQCYQRRRYAADALLQETP